MSGTHTSGFFLACLEFLFYPLLGGSSRRLHLEGTWVTLKRGKHKCFESYISKAPCEPCLPLLALTRKRRKKMFLPCHTGQKLDPDTELQFCYRAVFKMSGLCAGVRVLASALLARTELCLAMGHCGHCRIQSCILELHSLDARSTIEF